MVGSKDTKRKRKESPPPTQSSTPTAAQPTQSSSANIESSPEIPKRTKVQAQRKFAQGQSAPTASYSAASAAPTCSNGPSTSATSTSRDPPIEIIPNKTPKTDDFLTFLCFRGTNNLPPHLDFLNQSKSRGRPPKQPVTKRLAKTPKAAKATTAANSKPGKKGRKAPNRKEAAAAATATVTAITTTIAKEKTPNESAAASTTAKVETDLSSKTKAAAAATAATSTAKAPESIVENVVEEGKTPTDGNAAAADSTALPFAVRKRADQVAKGNRGNGNAARSGRQLRNTKAADSVGAKRNNSVQAEATAPSGDKRRSNRTSTKEAKPMIDTDEDDADDDDDEYEYYSAKDELIKADEAVSEPELKENNKAEAKKSPANAQKKVQTPPAKEETASSNKSKDQKKAARASAAKKGAPDATSSPEIAASASPTNSKAKDPAKRAAKTENPTPKDKPPPVKRLRQKESPIFIPSPEPSGRMTRQRAFFEPVKVPHRDEPEASEVFKPEVVAEKMKAKEAPVAEPPPKPQEQPKPSAAEAAKPKQQDKVDFKVFDFSSDDEQPLAKSIKLKANSSGRKRSPPKQAAPARGGRKAAPKKTSAEPQKDTKYEQAMKVHVTGDDADELPKDLPKEDKVEKAVSGNKRNKTAKTTESTPIAEVEPPQNASTDGNKPQEQQPTKAATTGRQARKRTKASDVNGENEAATVSSTSPSVRAQRPTRKTKEAATIYMGIIGHKLQLADDEDDDLSLNSFPDLPNVKEVEKMEIELKKNAMQALSSAEVAPAKTPSYTTAAFIISETVPSPILATKSPIRASSSQSPVNDAIEKPATARRGRPPKQAKAAATAAATKREVDLTAAAEKKTTAAYKKTEANLKAAALAQKDKDGGASEKSRLDSDDEDFLLSKEVNVTKRNLAKSFSDSDDEPLAIKVHVKQGEKEVAAEAKSTERQTQLTKTNQSAQPTPLSTFGAVPAASTKSAAASALPTPFAGQIHASPQQTHAEQQQSPTTAASMAAHTATASPFKPAEKKSPVPTSKILNVPATYSAPPQPGSAAAMNAANYSKAYMPQPLPPVAYHAPHLPIRTCSHPHSQMVPIRMPMPTPAPPQMVAIPPPPQSPLKYQPPPTTYPPPIEAYPSPKINPNFLTPKFDRMSMPRANFPSPSPVKLEPSSPSATTSAKPAPAAAATPKTPSTTTATPTQAASSNVVVASSSAAANAAAAVTAAAAAASASADPLKDEIGSILAANLMPSKEESGKIFGIASVSLAQSSGPDNTKCTLGKCGSIHKPVLGPVVPTESYIGDQMSSKERRKAKVNMTHEQIQKWLNECSPNPDEIQDDLDDDFDDNLRPNMNATTPPLTRDDKESTSLSSSWKATRDLGKSESVWSAKGPGPSQKATATAAPTTTATSKKDEKSPGERDASTLETTPAAADLKPVASQAQDKAENRANASSQVEKKAAEKSSRVAGKESPTVAQKKASKEKEAAVTPSGSEATAKVTKNASNEAAQQQPGTSPAAAVAAKTTGKFKNNAAATLPAEPKSNVSTPAAQSKTDTGGSTPSQAAAATSCASKTTKRTPVYNQKAQKQVELKETTTTSHRKTAPFSYGAFSADNEKSVYTFDKDDDDYDEEHAAKAKPTFRRQSRRDSQPKEEEAAPTAAPAATTSTTRTSPGRRRAAAAAADKANRDLANAANNSSVSLTLSSAEHSKQVKVSLDAEKAATSAKAPNAAPSKPATNAGKGAKGAAAKKQAASKQTNAATRNRSAGAAANKAEGGGDSDSDGHTFYIPLQGSSLGKDNNGSIQGVAVKLGREGPEGPNQKVIMHATLVTKAHIGADSMNASSADMVKTLETTLATSNSETPPAGGKKNAKAATAAAANSTASVSPKNVPAGAVQPRSKANAASVEAAATAAVTATAAASTSYAAGGNLVRVNSNSSLLSGSAKSRIGGCAAGTSAQAAHGSSAPPKKTFKDDAPIKMANNTAFPRHDDPTQMVEAPIFRPTEKEFADPIEFIERITPIAARFGICKIVPPATFKPECRISDDMRFTAYNQYVHKMLHRWGPSAKELSAIKKYLATQSIIMNHPPWIGGMEVDLPRLYHTVQELGGLKEVIEKKKWARVAEEMCIPKLAQDRVTKLDDIYCKYLLPYDTLSPPERQKLFDEVEADWAKREARARRNADRFVNTESVSNEGDDDTTEDDEESEEEVDGVSMECIVKGRSMALNQFYRIARNTMALWFKNTEPTVNEVEAEFWRHVAVRDSHVCVHSGSIDSSGWGYGFPSPGPKGKGSNYARHPWNLKVLTNNPGSVLRSLGPVMGVTVPTLHVGMLFSACCWYRDPHGLSWIEYLHTGASKLWYGIPDDQSANFRAALTSLIPTHCQNKTIWLPCDTVMVPPHMLTDRGVSLCRIEQKPGEFIVVFPRAYTSSLATGYVVSESVYFATTSWLELAKDDFRDIHESCEPAMFSLEQLLFALGHDQRVLSDTLEQMLPMLHEVCEKESAAREQLKAAGVASMEIVHNEKGAKAKKLLAPFKSVESECDLCRANLYISMVRTDEGNVYCLQHAIKNLNSGNIQAKQCKLIHAYQVDDIEKLIKVLNERIQQKRHVGVNRKTK